MNRTEFLKLPTGQQRKVITDLADGFNNRKKRSKRARKLDTTLILSNNALKELAWIAGERGGLAEVTRRISKRLRRPIARQQVAMWLIGPLRKRRQPRFGMGLLLNEIQLEMMEEREKGAIGL